jgi:hypothetical protein
MNGGRGLTTLLAGTTLLPITHFNHVQYSDIKYIHSDLQPSLLEMGSSKHFYHPELKLCI